MFSIRRRSASSVSVPNLKRIALLVQKLLRGPICRPAADPLPEVAGPPKFKQLEMVTACNYTPSLVKVDERNFELSWKQSRPARTPARPLQTHTATDRTDYNTLRRS